jgi:hypothetical protein
MRRRAPGEHVGRFRLSRDGPAIEILGRKAARWIADHEGALRTADPATPEQLNDRAADSWRPLLAIADAAGRDWPERARAAALTLSGDGAEHDQSLAATLLADIRQMFSERHTATLSSADLCSWLIERDDRPWSEFRRGKNITTLQLATLLRPYGISSKGVRIGDKTPRGYVAAEFEDAWSRYLPPVQSATAQQASNHEILPQISSATPESNVADEKCRKGPSIQDCCAVADEKGDEGAEVLRRLRAGEAVPYRSKVLGEDILLVPDGYILPPGETRPAYTVSELQEIARQKLSTADIKAVHQVKVKLNGEIKS